MDWFPLQPCELSCLSIFQMVLLKKKLIKTQQFIAAYTDYISHIAFFRLEIIGQRGTFKLHQSVCLNIKVSFITNKSSEVRA